MLTRFAPKLPSNTFAKEGIWAMEIEKPPLCGESGGIFSGRPQKVHAGESPRLSDGDRQGFLEIFTSRFSFGPLVSTHGLAEIMNG